jgi:hypothetical protein
LEKKKAAKASLYTMLAPAGGVDQATACERRLLYMHYQKKVQPVQLHPHLIHYTVVTVAPAQAQGIFLPTYRCLEMVADEILP